VLPAGRGNPFKERTRLRVDRLPVGVSHDIAAGDLVGAPSGGNLRDLSGMRCPGINCAFTKSTLSIEVALAIFW
jgi:hypothetical protein